MFLIKVALSSLVCGCLSYFGVVNIFDYNDFGNYANRESFIGPNFLYSITLRAISLDTLSHPILVILAIFGSVGIDIFCLLLLIQYSCDRKVLFIGYCLFCLHPYFAVYTFRLDTLFFSKLACMVFILHIANSGFFKFRFSSATVAVLVCFRLYAIIFMLGIFINRIIDSRFNIFNFKIVIFTTALIAYIVAVFYMNGSYATQIYFGSKNYGWDTSYSTSIFGNFGTIADNLLLLFIKILVLFGGREALFTHGFGYFMNDWVGMIQLFAFFFLAVFHVICIVKFISFTSYNKKVFITCLSLSPFTLL